VQAGYASNPSLFRNLPYDQSRDLLPVTNLASGPLVLVVHPSLPVRSVKELIALARAKPGSLNVGVPGTGSLNHLAAGLFNLNTGIRTTSVPYKGTGGALADVLAGNVEVYYMNLVLSQPYVKSGRLRAIGVTSAKRSPIAPDIPAIAEAGVRDFDLTTWFGLLAPGTTPADVVGRVHQEVLQVLALPDVRDRLAGDGLTVIGDAPEQFAAFVAAETTKAARIIKAAGISVRWVASTGHRCRSDHRSFRQDGGQHAQVVATQDGRDVVLGMAVALQSLDQVGQVLDLLETLHHRRLGRRAVSVADAARAVILDEIHAQRHVLHADQVDDVVDVLQHLLDRRVLAGHRERQREDADHAALGGDRADLVVV
jgi:tripartite-type tricarboxylate transporter receptor subunit TctC